MSDAQLIGYNGFKRLFRYMSRDRLEHAIRLKNKIVDYNDVNPDITVTYKTPQMLPNGSNMTIEAFLINAKTIATTQIERLEQAAEMAITDKEHMLMGILEYYIKDEEEELCLINRIIDEWTNAKKMGDASFLDRKDKCLHENFKTKETKKKYEY